MSKPSEGYTRIHPYISPETKMLIGMIMAKENKLMYEVIEKAIHQYSKPAAVAIKPQKTSAPKPNKTSPAPFALDSERQCGTCEEVKPLSDFYNSSSGKYGVEAHCKNCKNAKTTARRSLKK